MAFEASTVTRLDKRKRPTSYKYETRGSNQRRLPFPDRGAVVSWWSRKRSSSAGRLDEGSKFHR